jgi:hypothetical protein
MLAHVRHPLWVLICIGFATFTLWLAACSGGGDGGGGGGMPAPSALSYPTPPAFVVNQTITPLTPTVRGTVTSYTVSPALPAGLALNASTGVISGTPTAVAAKASYTVTAENAAGGTTTSVSIIVNDVAPSAAYAAPYIAYTAGVSAQSITPTTSGGAVVTWSVSPALPPGLALSQADGSISGQPTAAAPATNYTITATNSGGRSSANLTIAVAAAPLLDLGLVSSVTLIRYANSRVLSQDATGQWLLQNFTSGATLASGNAGGATLANGAASYVDLEGNVMIDQTAAGLDIRSATDGHVLASIPAPTGVSWYRLAADGSYVAAGSPTALMAWSTSGQGLFSKTGDYSLAVPFAAPGQIQVALGPAGQSVIETVSVTAGNSTTTPAFQGTFNSWFIDGQRFLTNTGNAVWTYSNAGVKQDLTSVTTTTDLTGQGNWFWTLADSGTLNVYQVGASGSPALTTAFGALTAAVPSGGTIGVLAYGVGQLTVIDLSGATPVSATYTLPYAYLSNYAAVSATQWLVGNDDGVVFDGTSLGGKPRSLTLGAAWSIAGGSGFVSVATASGSIFYFNASNDTLAGTIDFSSSTLSASSDGTVLAAEANSNEAQYQPDRTLNIYSLPSGALLNTFPYSYPNSNLYYMAMSGSASVIAEIFYPAPTGVCVTQVIPASGGATIFCDNTIVSSPSAIPDIELSPDGTLLATSMQLTDVNGTTNIYKNGTLVTAVPGQVAGWLDNTRLLVNEFTNEGMAGLQDSGTTIFDSLGNKLGTTPILNLGPFKVVSAGSVYLPSYTGFSTSRNVIVSLATGTSTWESANSTLGIGAISGSQVVFASGNLVLVQPF